MEADEDIDNETLQATVDASLAYVNDLVSSWMKPSNTPSSSRRDVEKEIEELMRRPPRLGVGAKPPESTDVSGRDALRLKGRLVDRKRGREEDTTTNIKTPSDDEDESRAGAIKKKPRLDPFDGAGKKKKKQKAPTPSEPGPSTAIVQELIEKASLGTKPDEVPSEPPNGTTLKDGPLPAAKVLSSPVDAVLNLDGPPPDLNPSSDQSPKKKRKKRKKKKNGDGDKIQS